MDNMKLYQYTEEFQNVLNFLEDNEDYSYDDLKDTLESIQMSAEEKVKNTGKVINKMNDDIEILKKHKAKIDEEIKKHEKKINNLKQYLLFNMQELKLKKVEDPLIKVSVTKSKSLVFTDETKIPEEWLNVKTTVKPDKAGFKKYYNSLSSEEQEKISYAHLEEKENIQVK